MELLKFTRNKAVLFALMYFLVVLALLKFQHGITKWKLVLWDGEINWLHDSHNLN